MTPEVRRAVAQALGGTGAGAIARVESIGGGCISAAAIVTLDDGGRYFVKSNGADLQGMYRCEIEGLAALRAAEALRVPQPVGTTVTEDGRTAVLVMEAIEGGPRRRGYFARLGEGLALLHRRTQSVRCGWREDNFLGSARQPGGWSDDWLAFVGQRRIGFQLQWARQQGRVTPEMDRLGRQLMDQLPTLLEGGEEAFVLLHGDLWSGNYLAGGSGEPVLIDPAVWYGRREAEFGMLRLFGNLPADFYEAYQAQWPLADGWERRSEVFRLYHLLNHLNLFGRGYLPDSLAAMRSLLVG